MIRQSLLSSLPSSPVDLREATASTFLGGGSMIRHSLSKSLFDFMSAGAIPTTVGLFIISECDDDDIV